MLVIKKTYQSLRRAVRRRETFQDGETEDSRALLSVRVGFLRSSAAADSLRNLTYIVGGRRPSLPLRGGLRAIHPTKTHEIPFP